MELERLDFEMTVCQLADARGFDLSAGFYFLCRTDGELSLVCRTGDVPANALRREDGWRGFRVRGALDFALVGVLARISGALAEAGIPLFAVSTYDTDYILVKARDFARASDVLAAAGFGIAG